MNSFLKSIKYFILAVLIYGCNQPKGEQSILLINSYHEGYGTSDDITQGIVATLSDKPVTLDIIYMDTKRNTDPEYINKVTQAILDSIERKAPDLIIAADDNAVQYIVSDHLKDSKIPIVFCGVNWSADQYDLPSSHITGMLEVLPFEQGIELSKRFYPNIQNVYVLSEYTNSEQKNTESIARICEDIDISLHYKLVEDFEAWKQGFLEACESSDLIYLPTNGAISNWDKEAAIEFVKANIKGPVITCDDFMMPYCVFGFTKVQSEQGIWAANTALEILNGKGPSTIPRAKNSQTQIWYNPFLAEMINIEPDQDFIDNSKVFQYVD